MLYIGSAAGYAEVPYWSEDDMYRVTSRRQHLQREKRIKKKHVDLLTLKEDSRQIKLHENGPWDWVTEGCGPCYQHYILLV